MKKLLVLLFALLSAQAFGQAYPGTVLQNSPGNYGRPVPFPQVLVCASSDNAVPCTTRVVTYTDDTLTTQCLQTGSSGLLIGNPTSGTGCNNPGIGDVNGNFQLYLANGEYTLCTFSGTWQCQKFTLGGSAGSGNVSNCATPHAVAYYAVAGIAIGCDPFFQTDGAGHALAKSLGLTDPTLAGYFYLTQGPAPTVAAVNSIYFYAPTSVTSYAWVLPGVAGSGCMQAANAAGLVTISFTGTNCGTGSGVTLQTNSVNNSSQTTLNLQTSATTFDGYTVSHTNTSGGNVKLGVTTPNTQASNPSTPTATVNGTAGSTDYKYAAVGCEDGPTCANHSAETAAVDVATGNATLTSTNSITLSAYADTLYGYRCYNIYRTSSSGTPSTTGLIANCVGKKFIDSGLAGDSTTGPSTNTTVLYPNIGDPTNACNVVPSAPHGIDGPPCAPKANNDEMTATFGAPGDTNDGFWTRVNGASTTYTWTNGMLTISQASGVGSDTLVCVFRPITVSAPYTFVASWYDNFSPSVRGMSFLAFRESATGKIVSVGRFVAAATSSGDIVVGKWTSATVNSSFPITGNPTSAPNPFYGQIQNNGTNTIYSWSADGVTYTTALSEAKNAFFTTAPDQYGLCLNPNGIGNMDIDYVRETQ